MERDITKIIDSLPNIDLQLDRIMIRHRHHCPKCGNIVHSRYHRVKNKPLERSDIITECPDCGDTVIRRDVKGKKTRCTFGTDNRVYDESTYLKEAKAAMETADPTDIFTYATLCERYAEEIELISDDKDEMYLPYYHEMSAMLTHLKTKGVADLKFICERTFKCNSISKLELLEVMRDIYRFAMDNKELLPKGLFHAIELEKAVLDNAFYGMFADPDLHIEYLWSIALAFEGLPEDERNTYPYVAADAYRYVFKQMEREGHSKKDIKDVCKRMIESLRDARKIGAPKDRRQMMNHLVARATLMDNGTAGYTKMLSESSIWDDDPYYLSLAYATYANRLFQLEFEKNIMLTARDINPKIRAKLIELTDSAIDILENESYLDDIATSFVECYLINGLVKDDKDIIRTTFRYTDMYNQVGILNDYDAKFIIQQIAINSELGSPMQRAAFKWLGMGSFLS